MLTLLNWVVIHLGKYLFDKLLWYHMGWTFPWVAENEEGLSQVAFVILVEKVTSDVSVIRVNMHGDLIVSAANGQGKELFGLC